MGSKTKPSLVLPPLNPTQPSSNNNLPPHNTPCSTEPPPSKPASRRPPLTIASVSFLNHPRKLSVSSQLSYHNSSDHDPHSTSPTTSSNNPTVPASVYPTTLSSSPFDPLSEDGGRLNDPQTIINDIQAAMNGISATSLTSNHHKELRVDNRSRSTSSSSIIRPIGSRTSRPSEPTNISQPKNETQSNQSLAIPSIRSSTSTLIQPSSTTTTNTTAVILPSSSSLSSSSSSHSPTVPPNQRADLLPASGHPASEDQNIDEIGFDPADLQILNSLGEGAGGEVKKVLHKPSGLYMAKKTIPTSPNPSVHRQILRELAFNREVADGDSPSIVKYYGAFLEENNTQIAILMEYCEGGSLEAIYKRIKVRSGRIGEKILGKVAESVLSGLSYLHTRKIIHRDIKPSNILVSKDGLIKLCDLGVSGELVGSLAGTFMGTSAYMAPERIRGEKYSITSDVWSLGLTLLELAMNRFPLMNINEDGLATPLQPFELLQTVITFEMPNLDELEEGVRWTKAVQHFLKTCLDQNPNRRPGPKMLLDQHPWIAKSQTWNPDIPTWLIKVWEW